MMITLNMYHLLHNFFLSSSLAFVSTEQIKQGHGCLNYHTVAQKIFLSILHKSYDT